MTTERARKKKLVIGLVGGIGSGKSFVAHLLGRMGGYVIEADKLGHAALCQPQLREQIVHHFGKQVLNDRGEIDRRCLAAIVFSQPQKRSILEAIVHPYIGQRIQEELAHAQADPKSRFIVLDAALLLEAGWDHVCDKILFIEAPPELRQQRTQQSRGWSYAEWQAREAAQWPIERKRASADAVLPNTADEQSLRIHLQDLLTNWLGGSS
ncbi:MAG: dephospho-CoA kinase [Gemmatales bacterium]|nr:dephospho-CoA kinase [Gemmatales bacterium]MDW7995482.1 dephospho-CoA kinase [Gemmatales bacterium]